MKELQSDRNFSEINLLEKFKVKGNSEESTITVGRAIDQDVSLYRTDVPTAAKAAVSRAHAELKYILEEDGNYSTYIRDVKSTNGTFVNSKRISNVFIQLNDGDDIIFGGNSAIKEGEDESEWKSQGKVLLRAFAFMYSLCEGPQGDKAGHSSAADPAQRLSQTSIKAAAEDTTAISESQTKKARQLQDVSSPKAAHSSSSSSKPAVQSSSSSAHPKSMKLPEPQEFEKDEEEEEDYDDDEMDAGDAVDELEDEEEDDDDDDEDESAPSKTKVPASLKLLAKPVKSSGGGSLFKGKLEPPPPIRAAASAATKALAASAMKKSVPVPSAKSSKADKDFGKKAVESAKAAKIRKLKESVEASKRAKEAAKNKNKPQKGASSGKGGKVSRRIEDDDDDEEEEEEDEEKDEDEDEEVEDEDNDDDEGDEEEEEEEEDPRKKSAVKANATGKSPAGNAPPRASPQASGQPPKKMMKVDGGGSRTQSSSASSNVDAPDFEFKFCAGCGRQYTSHVHRFCPACGMKRE